MSKKKTATSDDAWFYYVLIIQRVTILFCVGSTLLYWGHMLALAMGSLLYSSRGASPISQTARDEIDALLSGSMKLAIFFSITAFAATLLLHTAEKNNHTRTVTGLVIAFFCLFVTVFGQALYRLFISSLG